MCYNLYTMKKIIYILFCLLFFTPAVRAEISEEYTQELFETEYQDEVILENVSASKFSDQKISERVDSDDATDNTETQFEFFNIFDKEKDNKVHEDTLFGKIINSQITRTDVPSFLLQEELTFKFDKGIISKIQPFAVYNGSLNSIWNGGNYSTKYGNTINQIGFINSFRNPDYKFQLILNPIHKHGTNYLEHFISDAFFVNTSIPHHQIVAGYSRVQTGVEGGKSSYILPFATRSQIARNFGNSRSIAVKLIGNYQYIDYSLAGGSSGRTIISGFPGAEFAGWVNFKPLGDRSKKYGKITIGGGYTGGHNRIDYNIGSLYLAYHHKKLWTNFETSIADGYSGSLGINSNKACGWAYTAGWKFNPHFQLIGRVDQFDPNRHKSHDSKREYTIGLNWFIKGQALKLVLNYVFCDNQAMKNSHKIILATQIML